MKRTVIFYRKMNKECPIEDFLDSSSGKVAKKITWVLSLVEDLEIIPAQYFKKLSGASDIWECRIKLGNNIYRIFCFFHKNNTVVLTHGIVKKTQKTPVKEIRRAETYKQDYLNRAR